MEITVLVKSVYGQEKIYPVCKKALLFAELTGTKTLSRSDIAVIKDLGFIVTVQQQNI